MRRPKQAGDAVIPEDVRRFVLTSIPSVPHVEAALLFHREPRSEQTCAEVARALYLPEQRAAELLDQLCDAGILAVRAQEGFYRFAPRDPALAEAIRRLAETYANDMIGVTHLIHDATGKSAQRFADAFRLRKGR